MEPSSCRSRRGRARAARCDSGCGAASCPGATRSSRTWRQRSERSQASHTRSGPRSPDRSRSSAPDRPARSARRTWSIACPGRARGGPRRHESLLLTADLDRQRDRASGGPRGVRRAARHGPPPFRSRTDDEPNRALEDRRSDTVTVAPARRSNTMAVITSLGCDLPPLLRSLRKARARFHVHTSADVTSICVAASDAGSQRWGTGIVSRGWHGCGCRDEGADANVMISPPPRQLPRLGGEDVGRRTRPETGQGPAARGFHRSQVLAPVTRDAAELARCHGQVGGVGRRHYGVGFSGQRPGHEPSKNWTPVGYCLHRHIASRSRAENLHDAAHVMRRRRVVARRDRARPDAERSSSRIRSRPPGGRTSPIYTAGGGRVGEGALGRRILRLDVVGYVSTKPPLRRMSSCAARAP